MKLDGEQVRCRGTVNCKSDCKPNGYNNAAIDSVGHDSENGLENKDQNGTFGDLKASEGKINQLQCAVKNEDVWTTPNHDPFMHADDSTNDDDVKLRNFVATIPMARSAMETESFEKDSVFYVDKSVMEPELPEFVVCYKENTYHVVKDICIDKGFPSKDKFLFDTDVDEKNLSTFLNEGIDSEKAHKKEIFSLGELFSMPEMGAKLSQSPSDNSMDEAKEQSQRPGENSNLGKPCAYEESENGNKQEFLTSAMTASVDEELDCDNCDHKEAVSLTLGPDSASKASDCGGDGPVLSSLPDSAPEESEDDNKEETSERHDTDVVSDLSNNIGDESYNSKVETNSSKAARSWGGEDSQTGDSKHSETQNSSRHEDIRTESFSSQFQYTHGESSFSAAGPLSGLISYSGPIAYSGSLSLRSDSSTTSTRSFAFPVLQTEWNSSPVRMAKADRRHFHKHRSWRQVLLCCRF